MLAIAMNGQPLPVQHGFPVRMVVPGLYGYVSATKWLVDLEVTTFDKFSAFWTERGWSEKGPVKTQSRIDVPAQRGHGEGRVAARSAAAPGPSTPGIEKVEYQLDGGRLAGGRARPRARRRHLGAVGRHGRRRARRAPASSSARPTRPATRRPPAKADVRARRRDRMALHPVRRAVVCSRREEPEHGRTGRLPPWGALRGAAPRRGGSGEPRGLRARARPAGFEGLPSLRLLRPGRLQVLGHDGRARARAVGQLVAALWLYGKLPGAGRAPSWLGHRPPRERRAARSCCRCPVGVLLPLRPRLLARTRSGRGPSSTRWPGAPSTAPFAAKVLFVHTRRLPAGRCRWPAGCCSPRSWCSGGPGALVVSASRACIALSRSSVCPWTTSPAGRRGAGDGRERGDRPGRRTAPGAAGQRRGLHLALATRRRRSRLADEVASYGVRVEPPPARRRRRRRVRAGGRRGRRAARRAAHAGARRRAARADDAPEPGRARDDGRASSARTRAAFFNVVRPALAHLRAAEGSIVAVTTAATSRFPVRDGLSSAPKAAVEALVRALAVEEGRYGVRANCVGPGMLTDGMAAAADRERRARRPGPRGRPQPTSRCAGSGSPTTSPRRSASWPPRAPGSSAGRSWTSTAGYGA